MTISKAAEATRNQSGHGPYGQTDQLTRAYFEPLVDRYPGVPAALNQFIDQPAYASAVDLVRRFFDAYRPGDADDLSALCQVFADKTRVLKIVQSMLDDAALLERIAVASYPHPIGFDKLVLYEHPSTGARLRLHIYWRGNRRAALERLHLHRFEMASAIISGELTNHEWQVAHFDSDHSSLEAMEADRAQAELAETMFAYAGYLRDENGDLRKRHLGRCDVLRVRSNTFVSGQTYAQPVNVAHYVETNAETGLGNGDICSTVYLHTGVTADAVGRKIPVLFENQKLDDDDALIPRIPSIPADELRVSLSNYADLLAQSIEFYDWLYHPRHGRNLAAGMLAGYLLAERFQNPHVLQLWLKHEADCKSVLRRFSATLKSILSDNKPLDTLAWDDRNRRYIAILVDLAKRHPRGIDAWVQEYGDLTKEMWRYCGAIKGEMPDITVLKPVWQNVVGLPLPGGAHYGHVGAMIEAAYSAREVILGIGDRAVRYKLDGSPVCAADEAAEQTIRRILKAHYSDYYFVGEESGDQLGTVINEGARRWLVDPLDGTRNFLMGSDDAGVSIACQVYQSGQWHTTDGVIAELASDGRVLWAERDKGAFVIERDDLERPIDQGSEKSVGVAGKTIDLSVRGLGVAAEVALISDLRRAGAGYRATGSACLMLAMVARQVRDAAVITAANYDVAAGLLIARESGAHVEQVTFEREGRAFTVSVVAHGADAHRQLVNMTQQAIKPH